jgi:chorismate synthase
MTGNELGRYFRIITFGESHGKGVGVVVDGVRAGLRISENDIQKELDRRRPGQSRITTQRKEKDTVEIISGVFEGKTLGTPICLLVRNKEFRTSDYAAIKGLFRPGHAGYTYFMKFGRRDYRGGGRASGRETIGRVASAAIAKKILRKKGIKVTGYVKEAGGIRAQKLDFRQIEKNPVRCPDKAAAARIVKAIEKAKEKGSSIGGIVEIVATGVPAGLGEPVFSKLDAELAKALMGIGAVKGVEVGAGFSAARMEGAECNDEMRTVKGKVKFLSNNAGGILGGISTGSDIIMRIVVKPTASVQKTQRTVDERMKNRLIKTKGRHDPCICPRIVPVAEAMVALVLADFLSLPKGK